MDTKETFEITEAHKRLVNAVVRKFANSGLPEQDLFQEGMIALIRALQTFKQGGGAAFETYASRCIQNRLIDVVRKEAASGEVSSIWEEPVGGSLEDLIGAMEKSDAMKKLFNEELTDVERAVFKSYCYGYSYDEISKIFDISKKKIDNSIQKVRNKMRALINTNS